MLTDRGAYWGITVGGIAIIGTVILMLVLILNVSIPLFQQPSVEQIGSVPLSPDRPTPLVLGTDDYQEVAYAITAPNDIIFYSMESGEVMEQQIIPRPEGHDD